MKAIDYVEKLQEQFPDLADLGKEENKNVFFNFLQDYYKDFVTILQSRISKKDKSISVTGLVALVDEMNRKANVISFLLGKQAQRQILKLDWFLVLLEETAKESREYYNQYKDNPLAFFAVNSKSRIVIKFPK